jgi:signal transduction histidine kinase/DNA-binding response OmpR family regulator
MALVNKKDVHILVIDDEPGMRDLLSYELSNQGYRVSTATNGLEGIELVKKEKFRLIISDVKMPQMNGIEMLEKVKLIDPDIEVIMTTGYGTVENAVSAMKKGAYDFVLKPFNLEEIYMLVEKALEKSKLRALVALYEASKAIFSTVKLESLLTIVMDLIQKVLQADEGSVMLLESDGLLHIAASTGINQEEAKKIHIKVGERIAGLAAKERKEFLLINGLDQYPEFKGIAPNSRIKSSIVCPLIYNNELLGVLTVNRTTQKNHFNATDLQSASIFASQVALAVQNAKLYHELEIKVQELKTANQSLNSTQDQLLQSEKLASMGRLVAGVAHELNNPLTAVIGYTQLILEEGPQGELQRQLNIVFQQAQRCRHIVQNLLSFARRQRPQPKEVDPCALIDETLDGLSLEMKNREVRVQKKYPKGGAKIMGDANQLRQVFLNILGNATQALEETAGDRLIAISVAPQGEQVRILFSDNGPGISKELIGKIFDPFFTTKEVGKGTGLGLSLSYGIIKEHGGSLSVQSEKGKGATFIVTLPTKLWPVVEEIPPVQTHHQVKKTRHILCIEDEESVRGFVMTILGRDYKIDTAPDGEIALRKLNDNEYDLVLCDYMIPKINGLELYKKTKENNPSLAARFMFVSGSTEFIQDSAAFFSENNIPCLLKPFTKKELLIAIDNIFEHQKRENSKIIGAESSK